MRSAVQVAEDTPILIDRFLEDAFEMDVDCVCDGAGRAHRRHHGADRAGRRALGRQRLRHPHRDGERRGAGDAARLYPAPGPGAAHRGAAEHPVRHARMAWSMCIEVNPRASRTVPYVSKAIGVPWVQRGLPDHPERRRRWPSWASPTSPACGATLSKKWCCPLSSSRGSPPSCGPRCAAPAR